ncbi:MAG: hypothetical protein GC165_03910 [Armatimonadetes bacterium]|nr:hypothetical protein [Armatimonadota bacterium]
MILSAARLQGEYLDRIIHQVDYDGADVHDVLSAVTKEIGLKQAVDPDVHGNVTLHLRDTPSVAIIRKITDQIGAICFLRDGKLVVEHTPKYVPNLEGQTGTSDLTRIDIRDAIKSLCRGAKVDYSIDAYISGPSNIVIPEGNTGQVLATLVHTYGYQAQWNRGTVLEIIPEACKEPIQLVLNGLFSQLNAKYQIDDSAVPFLGHAIDVHSLKGKFEVTLANVLSEAGLTYRYEGGSFTILKDSKSKLSSEQHLVLSGLPSKQLAYSAIKSEQR